jgi:hypothetical protein
MIAVTRSLRVGGPGGRGVLQSRRGLAFRSMGGVRMAMSMAVMAVQVPGRLSSRLR